MNNIEKLLMAFIEAQGFHVKVTVDYDEQESNEQDYNMHESGLVRGFRKHFMHENDSGCLKYMSILLEPNVNYEVTKKNCIDIYSAGAVTEESFTKKERLSLLQQEIDILLKEDEYHEKDS